MAAYATLDDLHGLAPQMGRFTPTSKPTLEQATTFLADVARELDGLLGGMGYAVPIVEVTSPIAFARVKALNAWGALALAIVARSIGVTNPDEQGAGYVRKEYERRMKALRESPGDDLLDAVKTGQAIEKTSADLMASSFESATIDTDSAARMTRDQVF